MSFFSKSRLFAVVFAGSLLFAVPALASLPYLNQDLGYIIWLSDGWNEAPEADLTRLNFFNDGLNVQSAGWQAGYVLEGTSEVNLLVSELSGKVVSKAAIGNFNSHVVGQLKRLSNDDSHHQGPQIELKKANFDSGKNMLRLEMDGVDQRGQQVTSVVYIVYTRHGMLKFVGLAQQGDAAGVAAIDAAVATLYLERSLVR